MSTNVVVVIGGGPVGIQVALEQAKAGKKVYLVEKCLGLDGRTFVPSEGSFSPNLAELKNNGNIEVVTGAHIMSVQENDGRFKFKLRRMASRVIAEKCNDCRDCIRICPVNLWDDCNEDLSLRTAIDSSQAGVYNIVRENCPICQDTCPVHLDCRGYIGFIAEGKFEESLALIREKLPFPGSIGRICTHPCEQQCNRGAQDEALSIRALKRFVADYEIKTSGKSKIAVKGIRNEKVAVIGAGPAGLSCAHDLAVLGYKVTVFESLPVAGGMLSVGIPAYRLPKEILHREIDGIQELGVEIKTKITIGKDLTIDDLFAQGFKAVFIGTGAHQSQKLGISGEEAGGVIYGVDFLRKLNLGMKVDIGERVAVIGGGNVAMDAARSALRLGTKKVLVLYRRSRDEMPASKEEIEVAEAEGIGIEYLTAPVEILNGNGAMRIKCIRMKLGARDKSGRRRPEPIKDSEFQLEVDTIVAAIGQKPDMSFLDGGGGIAVTESGSVSVDPKTMATSRAGVFAGGDVVTGPAIAIEAIAAGKKAAADIDKYLRGE